MPSPSHVPCELSIPGGPFTMRLTLEDKRVVRVSLCDHRHNRLWADGVWDFLLEIECDGISHRATHVEVVSAVLIGTPGEGHWRIVMIPRFDSETAPSCSLEWRLGAPATAPWFEEGLTLHNGDRSMRIAALRTMLSHSITAPPLSYWPIPFPPRGAELVSVNLQDATPFESSRDGAALLTDTGGLIVARQPLAFSREPLFVGVRRTEDAVHFGSVWRGGIFPSGSRPLAPNERCDWGSAHYIPFDGPLEGGLTLYRSFMAERGVKRPPEYAPPLNYCIYYECRKHYTRPQLLECLGHAAELGCSLLYMDQGWEDYFSSGRWDETRFGRAEEIVQAARARGMDIGVLVGLHADTYVWPRDCWRKDPNGEVVRGDRWGHWIGICPTSETWRAEKTRRLAIVARAGVRFFSFDFNDGVEPCFDPEHGHALPLDLWEHARAVARQQRDVKKACPDVLIEAHCWRTSGSAYWPMYVFQGGHDERWGFEFMWDPFADLKAGRLQRLYYYNLAYETPLYLHIDLSKDSERQVVFWYVASTVRHLGIGHYTALDADRRSRVRDAVALYRAYREYFARGTFGGPDPLTHVHRLAGRGALILRFHPAEGPTEGRFTLSLDDLGCSRGVAEAQTLLGPPAVVRVFESHLSVEYRLQGEDLVMIHVSPA